MKILFLVLVTMFQVSAFANSEVAYNCETGMDSVNEEPLQRFELSGKVAFNEFIVNEEHRIWTVCAFSNDKNRTQIVCEIGQLPPNLPPEYQNHMNLEVAASLGMDDAPKNFHLSTDSYLGLKSSKHINFLPYIHCERK